MSKNHAGAVLHRHRQQEDRFLEELDRKMDAQTWTFESSAQCETPKDLADFLATAGIRLGRRKHDKTRANW